MLILLTFGGDRDHASLSPFCLKAMYLLKMSGRDWQPRYLSNPSRMPMGRLPVLKTDARLIADSSQIEAYLTERGTDFHAGLGVKERAHAHALIRMAEENLRYGLVHDRWLRDDVWAVMRVRLFGDVPAVMRGMVAGLVRRGVRKAVMAQGIGQFSEDGRVARLTRDIGAISDTLGDKDFLFGPDPTGADAAIVPHLAMIRSLPVDTGLRRAVRADARLCNWLDRVDEALTP